MVFFGLSEEDLDVAKVENVVQYLYKLYPALKSEIVFDEELQWLRYKPHPDKKEMLVIEENEVTSFAELLLVDINNGKSKQLQLCVVKTFSEASISPAQRNL